MKWSEPPVIKIYEALGAVADGRVEVKGDTAKVYSSSRNKYYDVTYDAAAHAIMTNDNGSYWKGYLGYPAIAYLLVINELSYREEYGEMLKGIKWKDINQKFKNDFNKTIDHIFSSLNHLQQESLKHYADETLIHIAFLDLHLLGQKQKPPQGY
jgi:hypothetical protein